jgi:hypothetical protein
MENLLNELAASGFDVHYFLSAGAVFAVAALILGWLGQAIWGAKNELSHAVSSAIGILFIYAATIVLYSMGARYQGFIAPLPFVSFSGTEMTLFNFFNADYTVICTQILSMIILAFLANLFDGILPKGKKLVGWLFFRCLTVVLAMAAHLAVDWLFTSILPEGLVTYAPTIVLGLLLLLLAVGALKVVVGALLATVNPLIGAFYTFFFATIAGKALSKAILTTAILTAIVLVLNDIGVAAVSIASAGLVAYVPVLLVLIVLWYVIGVIF